MGKTTIQNLKTSVAISRTIRVFAIQLTKELLIDLVRLTEIPGFGFLNPKFQENGLLGTKEVCEVTFSMRGLDYESVTGVKPGSWLVKREYAEFCEWVLTDKVFQERYRVLQHTKVEEKGVNQ